MVLVPVERESRDAFAVYSDDPAPADLHPHRERGGCGYVSQLFDRPEDPRPEYNHR